MQLDLPEQNSKCHDLSQRALGVAAYLEQADHLADKSIDHGRPMDLTDVIDFRKNMA